MSVKASDDALRTELQADYDNDFLEPGQPRTLADYDSGSTCNSSCTK